MKNGTVKPDSEGNFTGFSQTYGPVLTFILGVILSISIFSLVRDGEKSERQSLFEFNARKHLSALQTDILRNEDAVISITSLFSSSKIVTRKEFHSFTQKILTGRPSIQGIGWVPLINNIERKEYTKKAHLEGLDHFQITERDTQGNIVTEPVRDSYLAVYYIEPYSGNEKALGFNIASDSIRLQAINQARDTGQSVITERISLVQEQQASFGYLLLHPIYTPGEVIDTVAQRRKHFIGLSSGVFRFSGWIPSAIQSLQPSGMDVLIQDESAPFDKQFLYFHSSRTRNEIFKPAPQELEKLETGLHWRTTINVLGREWSFLFTPAPAFLAKYQSWTAWVLLLAGVLITFLLTLYFFTSTRYAAKMKSSHDRLYREITERESIDAALQESEKRYRSLVDSSPDWVWELDSRGIYTYASPRVYELLGYQPAEVVGKTPFDLMTPLDAERFGNIFNGILASERSFYNLENANLHKNGQVVVLETSGTPVLNDSGDLLGYRGIDRDITQRILNESEIKAQRDFTDTVLEAASNIIIVLDLKGRFVRFNRAAEELTGYSSEEVLGKTVWELVIPDEQRSAVKNVFNNLRKGDSPISNQYQNEWLTRGGGRCLLQWHNSILRDKDSNISHIVAMGYDISEMKKAEAERQRLQNELQQAHKMDSLGQLSGGIAHDFNNLLGIINGYANLIHDMYANQQEDKIAKYVKHIKQAGDRAAKLVAQMLAFSRNDQAEDVAVQLAPLLREDVKMLRATLPSTIEFKIEIEPDLPDILINPIQLHQILMNLVINARDAMQGSGQLNIKLAWARDLDTISTISHKPVKGDWLELSVSDSGSGIDEEMINSIFNPFFTTKQVGKGTGMGLAVIYGIMENHKGHILLTSEPGKGSIFRILFAPILGINNEVIQADQSTIELPGGNDSEILVVDDELSLATYIAELVKNHGYKSLAVTDSTEALALFQKEPDRFAMLITDQTMPRMTGIELVEQLKAIRPQLAVILCSGYSDKVNVEVAEELDVSFFGKPIDSKKLILKMAELLKR